MAQLGLDYAGGRPGGAAIAEANFAFVCRYLSDGGPGLPGKLLTPGEYADLQAHGVRVVLNWETTSNRMLGGHAAGVADGFAANAVAGALGVPGDRPIYFSCDMDATPAQQAVIDEYLQGAASVIGAGRVGIYGSYYVVRRCLDNGTATWAWQTVAWSGGQVEPRAHIYQRGGTVTVGGVPCDVNQAQRPDYGQHPRAATAREATMVVLPATEAPEDPDSDPATWAQVNYDIGFIGSPVIMFGVQEFSGPDPGHTARGFLRLASWITSDGTLEPVDPLFAVTGAGVLIADHWPTAQYQAPPGSVGITVNYSAPGGAYLAIG